MDHLVENVVDHLVENVVDHNRNVINAFYLSRYKRRKFFVKIFNKKLIQINKKIWFLNRLFILEKNRVWNAFKCGTL